MSYLDSLHENMPIEPVYDEPEVTLIGDASAVILGMPGGGFDGAYSMFDSGFRVRARRSRLNASVRSSGARTGRSHGKGRSSARHHQRSVTTSHVVPGSFCFPVTRSQN